ncbi:MAG: response regulator [Fuerstiella sp.]
MAEDGLVNQKVAMGLLTGQGHSVTLAENGRLAVAAWEQGEFDLILMDVSMPEMDGVEATSAIREKERGTGRHIPIVAMTAHAIKGDRERFLSAGMDAHVAKPVDPAELYEVVEQLSLAAPGCVDRVGESPDQQALNDDAVAGAVVDWQAALHTTGGDRELLRGVVQTALQEMPAIKLQLQDFIQEEELATTARVAHTMKSVASLFFAVKAEHAASVVETSASNNDLESAIQHLPFLMDAIDELINQCDDFVASEETCGFL